MDQGGQGNKMPIGDILKMYADKRRETERAQDEARKLGLPMPNEVRRADALSGLSHNQAVPTTAQPVGSDDDILTSEQAAKLLGFSTKSFRNAVAAGKVPHYKLFGQNRFRRDELLALLVKVDIK